MAHTISHDGVAHDKCNWMIGAAMMVRLRHLGGSASWAGHSTAQRKRPR